MMNRDQALEKFWLERRLELISKLDDLTHDDFYYGDESATEYQDRKIAMLRSNYADVWTPFNLEQTLKKVHVPNNYGGPQKTHAKATVRGKSNKNSKKAE